LVPVLKKMIQWKKKFCSSCFRTISPKTIRHSFRKNKNRYLNASLTAEAAMIFPVFFFTVYLLWQLFLLVLFQTEVCFQITGEAMKHAHLGYPARQSAEGAADISWLYQPLLWNALPESEHVEKLRLFCESEADGTIRVNVQYQFTCEAVFFSKYVIPVRQSFRFYPWLGKNDTDLFAKTGETDVVYMTENGTVYHESKACSYLTVEVRAVNVSEIEDERNSSGRRYTLCERCDDKEAGKQVYISAGGTKYHLVISCPALKRTVTERKRDAVEGIPACHKCGPKNKEE